LLKPQVASLRMTRGLQWDARHHVLLHCLLAAAERRGRRVGSCRAKGFS
jgi:hypothetical protein